MANPVKIKATVEEVVRHNATVASYRMAPQGRVPRFHAGQFLHLALDEYSPERQWPESRVFSIASAPSERAARLDVTISAKGRYTGRILETLQAGSECWLKLPYGEFLFPADRNLALVAGGVGITPFLSLLKQMLEERSSQPVALYYGVRSAEHYLFGDLLGRCAAELPNFSMTPYCEDGTAPGRRGALNIAEIHAAAPAGALFYLSGPPGMISAFKARLRDLGVEPGRVRVDDWE
jgi:ferredoxin-NADP reductase